MKYLFGKLNPIILKFAGDQKKAIPMIQVLVFMTAVFAIFCAQGFVPAHAQAPSEDFNLINPKYFFRF